MNTNPPAPRLPKVNVRCEVSMNLPEFPNAGGTTRLEVVKVEAEDDGSITAVIDYWPVRDGKPKPNCHQTHNDQEWPDGFNFCPHCGERLVAGLPIIFAREPERMLEKPAPEETGLPWCESCQSYHAEVTSPETARSLQCFAHRHLWEGGLTLSPSAELGQYIGWLEKAGICPDCGGEICHHGDEPAATCQGCGRGFGEWTGEPPLIDSLRTRLAIAEGHDRAEQLSRNCGWLIEKIDAIHANLCPRKHGTWQERAYSAVAASGTARHALHEALAEFECRGGAGTAPEAVQAFCDATAPRPEPDPGPDYALPEPRHHRSAERGNSALAAYNHQTGKGAE